MVSTKPLTLADIGKAMARVWYRQKRAAKLERKRNPVLKHCPFRSRAPIGKVGSVLRVRLPAGYQLAGGTCA